MKKKNVYHKEFDIPYKEQTFQQDIVRVPCMARMMAASLATVVDEAWIGDVMGVA